MLRCFAEKKDIHKLVASFILEKSYEFVTDEERSRNGKPVNFGIVYGQTPQGLSEKAGVSLKKAEYFIDSWFKLFPRVKEYYVSIEKRIHQYGVVENAFGRKRNLYGVLLFDRIVNKVSKYLKKTLTHVCSEMIRQAINFPIQAAGSELLNRSCVAINAELKRRKLRARFIHHHHDAIHLSCPVEEVILACKIVKACMEAPCKQLKNISFPCDIKVCKSWYGPDQEFTDLVKKEIA